MGKSHRVRWNTRRRPRHAGQCGGDLHSARTGSDDCDPPALDRHGVVPLGGVKRGATECLQPGDGGDGRLAQVSARRDEYVRMVLDRVAGGPEAPLATIPDRLGDLGVEPDVRVQARITGHSPEVFEDLLLR